MLMNLDKFKMPNFNFKDVANYFDKIKGQLHLPEDVVNKMKSLNVHTAEDFASYLKSFPSEAAKVLNTSVEEVQKMAKSLPSSLEKITGGKVSFGANDPKELDKE